MWSCELLINNECIVKHFNTIEEAITRRNLIADKREELLLQYVDTLE